MTSRSAILFLAVLVLSACGAQNTTFSWYHPQGGEYLFAYDSSACETDVVEQGRAMGMSIDGPFFTCMHQRGYYLVDSDGIVQAPPEPAIVAERQVSQQ